MARTLFFQMVVRKSSEITNSKPIFSQYNIFFTIMNISFSSLRFDLFSIITKKMNQIRNNVVCSSSCFLVLLCTHYRPLQYFSTYLRKLKEIRVLRPIFMLFFVTMVAMIFYFNITINISIIKNPVFSSQNPQHPF